MHGRQWTIGRLSVYDMIGWRQQKNIRKCWDKATKMFFVKHAIELSSGQKTRILTGTGRLTQTSILCRFLDSGNDSQIHRVHFSTKLGTNFDRFNKDFVKWCLSLLLPQHHLSRPQHTTTALHSISPGQSKSQSQASTPNDGGWGGGGCCCCCCTGRTDGSQV